MELMKSCHKKTNILIDVSVSAEFPEPYFWRHKTQEERAKDLEDKIKDFAAFIRDHRSLDPVFLHVERKYEDQCSACRHTWEPYTEDGKEICTYCGAIVEGIINGESSLQTTKTPANS